MSDQEALASRLRAYEQRWEEALEAASEFERRRYRSLSDRDRHCVMTLVGSGDVAALGEAIKAAPVGLVEFIQRRDGGAQRDA
jgi:hypothetical protein